LEIVWVDFYNLADTLSVECLVTDMQALFITILLACYCLVDTTDKHNS